MAAWDDDLDETDPSVRIETMNLDFGEELSRLMKEQNVSRTDLAIRMETGKSVVKAWLQGALSPSLAEVARMFLVLGHKVSLVVEPVVKEKKGYTLGDEPAGKGSPVH